MVVKSYILICKTFCLHVVKIDEEANENNSLQKKFINRHRKGVFDKATKEGPDYQLWDNRKWEGPDYLGGAGLSTEKKLPRRQIRLI